MIPRSVVAKASAHYLRMVQEDRTKANAEKRLYSIAAEVEVAPRRWQTEIAQIMAADQAAALAHYFLSQPKRVNIVACAPTLGFYVNDKDGKVLSTE